MKIDSEHQEIFAVLLKTAIEQLMDLATRMRLTSVFSVIVDIDNMKKNVTKWNETGFNVCSQAKDVPLDDTRKAGRPLGT